MSRWYASWAAAERGDQRRGVECLVALYVGAVGRDAGRTMMVFGQRAPDGVVTYDIARDVTGRSDRHIDRLARDWILEGISPCRDGSRGAAQRTRRDRVVRR